MPRAPRVETSPVLREVAGLSDAEIMQEVIRLCADPPEIMPPHTALRIICLVIEISRHRDVLVDLLDDCQPWEDLVDEAADWCEADGWYLG